MNNVDKVKEFAEKFDKFRDHLRQECTKPIGSYTNSDEHKKNKEKYEKFMFKEIGSAQYNPKISFQNLFKKSWEKIYYAGFNSYQATKLIDSINKYSIFDDFKELTKKSWEFDKDEWIEYRTYCMGKYGKKDWIKKSRSEEERDFLIKKFFKKSGKTSIQMMTKSHKHFSTGLQMKSNEHKMDKIIKLANLFNKLEKKGVKYPLEYFVGDEYLNEDQSNISNETFKEIHSNFNRYLGESGITSLHLMMELGFPCVKPDIVLTGLFCDLGFLEKLETHKKWSSEKIKENYTHESVVNTVLDVGNKIAKEINSIYGNNSLRELDLVVVKFGQEPARDIGIVRNLNKELLKNGYSILDVMKNIDDEKALKSLYK